VYVGGKWKPIEEVEIGEQSNYGTVEDITCHPAESIVEIEAE